MRELLTEQEINLLHTFAELNMKVQPTAEATHYNRRTIYRILESIRRRVGYDPQEFKGLFTIMQTLEKEGARGR